MTLPSSWLDEKSDEQQDKDYLFAKDRCGRSVECWSQDKDSMTDGESRMRPENR